MLPIALTCPVWWVARWTARTLATLAVLVACSFGAATLPLGVAATAPVAPAVVAPVEGLPLRTEAAVGQHLRGAQATSSRNVPTTVGADPTAAGTMTGLGGGTIAVTAAGQDLGRGTIAVTVAGQDVGGGITAVTAAGQDVGGAAADTRAVPAVVSVPVAPLSAVTGVTGRPLVLTGLVPATVGSRAPPAR
ncbi:hypothetical protein [Micromonospora sp. CA-244673]|uniref:hypothetical protein n=1 Tax=Micromonospora sp. CA-244673 TaxID=3239958 RepID=UPI003D8F0252